MIGAAIRRLGLMVVLGSTLLACDALPLVTADGVVVDGWVFPTPAPLPDGATRLPLDVQPPPANVPANVEMGACPAALHEPVTLRVDRSTDPPILGFVGPDGRPATLRWSYGVSAREIGGVAEVVMPDGSLVVREGEQTVMALGGGSSGQGDVFGVCITSPRRLDT